MGVRGVSYIRSNLGTPGENAALSPRGADGWGQRAYNIAETGLLGCIVTCKSHCMNSLMCCGMV